MAFERVSAGDLVEAYISGDARPQDVVERALAAVDASQAHDPPLAAFIALNKDEIREQADASWARYEKGQPISPLDGVPVAIKDAVDAAGYRTTGGTSIRREAPLAASDGSVVARLRSAGAIIFGKTNLHEVGLGGTGINPHYGTPRNPWDPGRLPGGSSSGSAVAVSSGLVPLALGSDAGGSIRIPAALCGVFGLKPTYGRVPTSGAALLAWTLDHLGPLGASPADLAAFLDVTAGADGVDPAGAGQPGLESGMGKADLSGLSLAYCPTFGMEGAPEVVGAFQEVITHLREAGASVESVELEYAEQIQAVGYLTLAAEGAASQRDLLEQRSGLGGDVRLLLSVGGRITAVEYLHAQRIRRAIRREFESLLDRFDAFLNPTCACVAPMLRKDAQKVGEVDDETNAVLSAYTFAGNLSGLPSLSVPIGVSRAGGDRPLPIGLQLMGAAWSEKRLLAMGEALVDLAGGMPRPQIYYDILGVS